MDTRAPERAAFGWYRMRSAQYDAIYVSPHMDDAVYSCGGQIALQRDADKRVLLVTVFGHGERPEHAPGVFRDYTQRKREEQAASALLDVDHLWLNLPDLLARPTRPTELVRFVVPFMTLGPTPESEQLTATLQALFTRLLAPAGHVYAPLGIGAHPDHRIVFEATRGLLAQAGLPHSFYEDVPYAQVRTVRDDRLHFLGLPRNSPGVRVAAAELRAFAFAHAPRWQRPLLTLVVGAHWCLMRALFELAPPPTHWLAETDLTECVIDDVLERKVQAMRAYVTQTDYFFPRGEAIYGVLSRAGEHYVERYWTPKHIPAARAPAVDAERLARELARVDALRGELRATGET
jgi:LmbE family N-acetylglucosaminyl deacetylase